MKLSLTLTDERPKSRTTTYYDSRPVEMEEYERANVDRAAAPASVVAGILRALADDIDPKSRNDIAPGMLR